MKNFIKKTVTCLFVLIILIFFLIKPALTGDYAYIGLTIWYKNMIISLLPVTILVNLLLASGLYKPLMRPLTRLTATIFRLSEEGIFAVVFGFLAGFPLGAKITTDLYLEKKISKQAAEYLLAFTNNIGPAYFTGFVLTRICPGHNKYFALWIMYGIPLLYGILLRHTVYRNMHMSSSQSKIHASETSFLAILPGCIQLSLCQMAMLGGYMVFFNALRVIPHVLLCRYREVLIFCHTLLEISGGLKCLLINVKDSPFYLLFVHAALSFGGLCCFFQTASLLSQTDLSAKKYMLHKIILCSITIMFCLFLIKR